MRSYHFLPTLSGLFVAVLLISGIISTKIIHIGGGEFDGGTLLFPLSYIFGDILTEVYGYKRSRSVIRTGMISMILMSGMIFFISILPASSEWIYEESYNVILLNTPRIFLGSIVAYSIGEFINSYILARLKIYFKGKYLFGRIIGSTIIGQAFDTIIFSIIAFGGLFSRTTVGVIILSNYIFKVIVEIILYPITKYIIIKIKQKENEDFYDTNTNFNPFSLS